MKKNNIESTSKKRTSLLAGTALVAAGIAFLTTPSAFAEVGATELPTGGTVAEGSAGFSSPDASTLQINQNTDRVVIDWNSFNIGENATTEFVQPNSGSMAVNRIHDADASQILGTLKANGQIMLLNSNGVLFGENATIDVGGIIASTGELVNTDAFMNGANPALSNFGNGSVINNATITVADAGLAAFVAPAVVNNGVIAAKAGRIGLAGANGDTTVTVDLYGDGLFELAAGTQSGSVSVDNQGTASAEGGVILLTAATAKNIVDGVINTDGLLDVQSVTVEGGKIILSAGANGDVTATGTMDASGTNGGLVDVYGQNVDMDASVHADGGTGDNGSGNGGDIYIIGENTATVRGTITAKGGDNGGNGGFVETSGYDTISISNLIVNTMAPNGNNGLWLIDPVNLTVDDEMAATISAALSDIYLQADNSITFNADINILAQDVNLTAEAGSNGINMTANIIRTNSGDITWLTTGAIDISNATMFTRGGNIVLNGDSVSINNNAALSSGGGDVDISAVGTVNINRSLIDASGGDVAGGIILDINGSVFDEDGEWQTYKGHFESTAETGVNGGTITITSDDYIGQPNNCFSAGGGTCFVADPIPVVELLIYLEDYFKTYGENDPLFSWDGLFDEGALEDGDSLTFSMDRDAGENAGSYTVYETDVVLTNTSGTEYSLNIVDGTLTINKADLLVTANDDSKTYDGLAYNGGNGVTYNGFVNGDDSGDLGGLLTYGGTAQGAVDAGTYAITASGLTSGNYNISYDNGTLTVDQATLTIAADSFNKTYGDTYNFDGTEFTTSGLVNGETITSATLASTGAEATATVGGYGITITDATGGTADLSNYDVTYVGGTLTVDKAALTVTANSGSKTYGTTYNFDGTEFTTSGLVNDDDITFVTLTSDGAPADANVGNYDIDADSATGTGLENYDISYVNGTLTVDKAMLTVTADGQTMTYGGSLPTLTASYGGFVNGDDSGDLGGLLTYGGTAQGAVDAGTYTITASGLTSGNYNIDYTNGTLTVDKADLLLTANNGSKTYGETYSFDGNEYTTSGLVDGDLIDSVSLTTTGSDATANAGDYVITISNATGDDLANYNVDYANGTLTVDPASLAVAADEQSKNFGEDDPELTYEMTAGELLFEDTLFGELSREEGEATGEYQILQNSLSAGANYTITYVGNVLTIWPLAPQPEADIAQEDIFNPEFNPEQESGVGLSVTVTGLPALPGTNNAPSAFDLAAIAPAAGGENGQSAEEIAAIEPAAGDSEFAGCWDDTIFGAETGVNTTYSFDYGPSDLLEDTANCGVAPVSE